ncbi:hypothetical protein K491DRAFT_189560 [Lophiostoma macrostomum CBS 122681]|uniref:Uncharacterized protein n=1 Tax=Lophiostoma macrostomum CBS 122681 TaxID=1314788 RepID=A0A6A6TVL8_9PLEO|nr:hypothetical protein K491DRAFT_189560 [Lophiostoma macrostomum CBS 122681]
MKRILWPTSYLLLLNNLSLNKAYMPSCGTAGQASISLTSAMVNASYQGARNTLAIACNVAQGHQNTSSAQKKASMST